jgi:hypothetical protein
VPAHQPGGPISGRSATGQRPIPQVARHTEKRPRSARGRGRLKTPPVWVHRWGTFLCGGEPSFSFAGFGGSNAPAFPLYDDVSPAAWPYLVYIYGGCPYSHGVTDDMAARRVCRAGGGTGASA